jgi:hypothetical protein
VHGGANKREDQGLMRGLGVARHITMAEQRNKEQLISLEMARTKSESGRVDMEKRVDGLKLEVHRLNLFLECENLEHHDQPGIIGTKESAAPTPPPGTTADGPDGHHVELQHRDNEFGSNSSHAHVPVNGTLPPSTSLLVLHCFMSLILVARALLMPSWCALVRVICLRSIFPCLMARNLSFGDPVARAISRCMVLSPPCGLRLPLCTLRAQRPIGSNPLSDGCVSHLGRCFVL